MKKVSLFFALGCAVALASCGGGDNKSKSTDSEEEVVNIEEVEDEDSKIKPPFSIVAVSEWLEYNDYDRAVLGTRVYYTIEVKANGTYEAVGNVEDFDNYGKMWYPKDEYDFEHSGRWTVEHRAMGDSYQDVYDLHFPSGDTFAYIPDDLEYFWSGKTIDHYKAGWSDCANLNMNKAIRIAEIITPKGKKVIIPENERVMKEPEAPEGPNIIGNTYEYVSNSYSLCDDYTCKECTCHITFQHDEAIAEFIVKEDGVEVKHDKETTKYKYKYPYIRLGKEVRISDGTTMSSGKVVSDSVINMWYNLNLVK